MKYRLHSRPTPTESSAVSPGVVSSKLIRYRIASPLSRRTRARRLRCCLRAPSKRPCSKKRARPKRRCASAVGPTRPDCSRRSEKRGGRCSRLSISFKGSFGPVLLSVGTAVAVARATVVVAPRTGRIVAAPTRGCRISPAEWRSSNRTCRADRAGRNRAGGIDRASRDVQRRQPQDWDRSRARPGGHVDANQPPYACAAKRASDWFARSRSRPTARRHAVQTSQKRRASCRQRSSLRSQFFQNSFCSSPWLDASRPGALPRPSGKRSVRSRVPGFVADRCFITGQMAGGNKFERMPDAPSRHARAWRGHPRLPSSFRGLKDVDRRAKASESDAVVWTAMSGHDERR